MSSSLYSGVSGLAIGTGLYKGAAGLWGNSSGLISGWGGFSPASLFLAGEPGAWYDPSDLSTLYQDAAGTTPVTAVGQTVGLVLDKSKGLVLGSELKDSGTTDLVGTATNASYDTTTGVGAVSRGADLANQSFVRFTSLGANAFYLFSIQNTGAIPLYIRAGSPSGSILASVNSGQSFRGYVTGSAAYVITAANANTTANFTVNTIRELPGNHATQSVLASRPILAREPLGGRRNLLTYTEQFDNTSWTKTRSSISPNVAIAPDGSITADKLVEDTSSQDHRLTYNQSITLSTSSPASGSIYMKAAGRNFFRFYLLYIPSSPSWTVNLTTGEINILSGGSLVSVSTTNVGNGWWRINWTFTAQTATAIGAIYGSISQDAAGTINYTGDGFSGIYIWGAQLEAGSTATAYQRVVSTSDVTEAGKPDLWYLLFDGSDDFLVTNTITPGTDKAQVFAGVRKLSDAASGMLVESSAFSGSNDGAFGVFAPSSVAPNYLFQSRGTLLRTVNPSGFAAPITNVLTGIGDIAADTCILRVDGNQAASNTSDQGTGNYLAYPVYIGRRGGTTLPFNGRIYSLIVRFGPNLSGVQIAQTEAWVNSKTGAY